MNRSSAIEFQGPGIQLACLGVHGAHDSTAAEHMADLCVLANSIRGCRHRVAMGDWNIDLLPSLACDPYQGIVDRESKHQLQRIMANSFADRMCLGIAIPDPDLLSCTCLAPVSRIAEGDQVARDSLLDWAMGSDGTILNSALCFSYACSDHAWLRVKTSVVHVPEAPRKSHFVCINDEAAIQWLRDADLNAIWASSTLEPVFDLLEAVQSTFGNRATCSARSQERLPAAIRTLFQGAAQETSDSERRAKKNMAMAMLRDHRRECERAKMVDTINKGGVASRSKKLHKITALNLPDTSARKHTECVHAEMCMLELGRVFEGRWGAHDSPKQAELKEFLSKRAGDSVKVSSSDFDDAILKIKKKGKLDAHGQCVKSLGLLRLADGEGTCRWLSQVMAKTTTFEQLVIRGFVAGKTSSQPQPEDTRAVMPMPALGQVIDSLCEKAVLDFIDRHPCRHSGVFVGGCKGTQPLDIAASIQIGVEKCLDSKSAGCIAQFDLARYYDSIDLLEVLRSMEQQGFDPGWSRIIASAQFLPQVSLAAMRTTCVITGRCRATVTGSRTANACARWPVLQAMHHMAPSLHRYGFQTAEPGGSQVVCLQTWIDNIYCIGRTQHLASTCMEKLESYFRDRWNLPIKPSSKLFMLPRGARDEQCFGSEWTATKMFPVLGHMIADSGGIRQCWTQTKASLWRAFWGNCRNRNVRHDKRKALTLLQRSVYPVVNFRASRWPPQKTVAHELDQKTQASMIACITRSTKLAGESVASFCRRRMRVAHAIAAENGNWSLKWFARFGAWNEHLDRHPTHPASRLLAVRDSAWLRQRRASITPGNLVRTKWTIDAGHSGTRACSGYVAQRWEAGRVFGNSQLHRRP